MCVTASIDRVPSRDGAGAVPSPLLHPIESTGMGCTKIALNTHQHVLAAPLAAVI